MDLDCEGRFRWLHRIDAVYVGAKLRWEKSLKNSKASQLTSLQDYMSYVILKKNTFYEEAARIVPDFLHYP